MKAYFRECVLLLTIALCTMCARIVNGAATEQSDNQESAHEGRTTKVPQSKCTNYFYECYTKAMVDWCQACTTTDASETAANNQGSPQCIGGDILPIVIASIVSFIAGVGACLLVLCLIGHFHGRLCLKFTNSSKYVEKTAKSRNQAPKSQTYTTSAIDMTEHEYRDLRCETMPNTNRKPQHSSENISPVRQKQPNSTTQSPAYETMSDAQKEHVYSGLGSRESNHSTEYEHTSPNRSSEHVYSGILNDTQPSDPTTRQQPSTVNTPGGMSDTNIDDDRSMHDTGDNRVEPNDYFVLEKEEHSTNHLKPEARKVTDDCSMPEYFVLAKEEQHAANQPEPEAGQGTDGHSMVIHDSGECHMEPNDYFVLEKESHSANQPKVVHEANFGGVETADDTEDYHPYHTLQKL